MGLIREIYLRPGSSDSKCFEQVFVKECFAPIADAKDVKFVVDAGANVGFSSLWFLETFPECEVLAIEPDVDNFMSMVENTRGFTPRMHRMRAGLWSHDTNLVIEPGRFRDGKEWSIQVRECQPGECWSCFGFSLPTAVHGLPYDRIDILKVDIEGAEVKVFSGDAGWLDSVRNIVIELHDDSEFGPASPVFFDAIKDKGFICEPHGEHWLCRKVTPS